MALIVEDGSIVPNANSFNSLAELRAYATSRGVTLPVDDTAAEVIAIRAMDYIRYYRTRYIGELVEPGVQTLPFPRKNAYLQGQKTPLPDDIIWPDIKEAQAALAVEIQNGVNILPSSSASSSAVIREKVDVIETEYSEAIMLATMGQLPTMPYVTSLLAPYLSQAFGQLITRRV